MSWAGVTRERNLRNLSLDSEAYDGTARGTTLELPGTDTFAEFRRVPSRFHPAVPSFPLDSKGEFRQFRYSHLPDRILFLPTGRAT